MKRKIVLIFILTCIFSLASKADEPVVVSLKDKVTLQTDVLSIQDIVNEEGTDAGFIEKFGHLKLANLSLSDHRITQTRLLALLYKSGADVNGIQFRNAASIELERGQDIVLPPSLRARITKDLTNTFNIPASSISMENTRVLPALSDEDYQLLQVKKIHAIKLDDLENAHFKLYVRDLDGKLASHDLYMNLKINTTIYTANAALNKGKTLEKNDLSSKRTLLKSLSGRLASPEKIRQGTFKSNTDIAQDEIILDSMLQEIRLVEEGSAVTLSYRTPMLHVRTQGILLESSEIGQLVRAENTDSKRSVTGTLVSKDLVEVANVD